MSWHAGALWILNSSAYWFGYSQGNWHVFATFKAPFYQGKYIGKIRVSLNDVHIKKNSTDYPAARMLARLLASLTFVAIPTVERFRRHFDNALEQHCAAARRTYQIDDRFDDGRN